MSYVFLEDTHAVPNSHSRKTMMYDRWGKRVLDVFAVVLVLPIALPMLLVALIITKKDGGSGLFPHARVGRSGKVFNCWKLRTMVPDAELRLQEMLAGNSQIKSEWSTNQKLDDDPRITTWGKILRRYSVDELPQLWNVLKGDMSLLGPRPFTPEQRNLYDGSIANSAYYRMRPGISGLWQVECRNSGSFVERVSFDEIYFRQISLKSDLMLLIKTVSVILRATGK